MDVRRRLVVSAIKCLHASMCPLFPCKEHTHASSKEKTHSPVQLLRPTQNPESLASIRSLWFSGSNPFDCSLWFRLCPWEGSFLVHSSQWIHLKLEAMPFLGATQLLCFTFCLMLIWGPQDYFRNQAILKLHRTVLRCLWWHTSLRHLVGFSLYIQWVHGNVTTSKDFYLWLCFLHLLNLLSFTPSLLSSSLFSQFRGGYRDAIWKKAWVGK